MIENKICMTTKTILCLGDWGHDNPSDNMRYFFHKVLNFNEMYLLGDNFYPSGVENVHDRQWRDKLNHLFPLSKPKFACLGNHDYLGNIHAQFDYTNSFGNKTQWYCPGPFYERVDWKTNTHVLFIDTQILAADITIPLLYGCGASNHAIETYLRFHRNYYEKQLIWLESTLKNSTAKFKIVCGHYPLFSNGPHPVSNHLQNLIIPILKKYSVDIYLSGHDHNSQCIHHDGILYIVAGGFITEGYNIQRVSKNSLFHENEPGVFLLRYNSQTWNICHVDLKTKIEKIIHMILKY